MQILVNTQYFSEAANYKRKHGVYISAPYGSKDYSDFWKEQDRRCLEGYTVAGDRITGYHYWFLNFKQLERVINMKNKDVISKMRIAVKKLIQDQATIEIARQDILPFSPQERQQRKCLPIYSMTSNINLILST